MGLYLASLALSPEQSFQQRPTECLCFVVNFCRVTREPTLITSACPQVPSSSVQLAAGEEEGGVQERRLQRHPRERGQEATAILARHLHDSCGRAVEMDPPRVRSQLPSVLARVRYHLVAHRVLTRGPESRKQSKSGSSTCCFGGQ
jgi:hypothetical protein